MSGGIRLPAVYVSAARTKGESMEIERRSGYFITANYRVLDYEFRRTNDLFIVCCGEERNAAKTVVGPCIRDGWHLHFITAGSGYLATKGMTMKLSHGQLFLLQPGVEYTYWADKENPWSYAWIQFDGLNAASYMKEAGFPRECYIRDSIIEPETYVDVIRDILGIQGLTLWEELKRTSLLYQVIGLLVESYSTKCYPQKNHYNYSPQTYVSRAVAYIHKNYAQTNVSQLADYIGINRSYFTAIFKRLVGVSPQEYLLSYRMEESVKLLTESSLPIKTIAASVGYENPLTFSKIFKSRFGCSPQNYRKEHKGQNDAQVL